MATKRICLTFVITILLEPVQSGSNGQTILPWSPKHPNIILESPAISPECEEVEICNNVTNYPMEFAISLLEELKEKNIVKYKIERLNMETDDYENMCSHKAEIIYPQAAKDLNGTWRFILNGKNKPFQGFRVEMCKSSTCPHKPLYSGLKINCEQRNIYRKMVYLDTVKNRLAIDYFQLPGCCFCNLQSEYE